MLALALMAGADPEALGPSTACTAIAPTTRRRSSPHLMARNQVKGCGNAGEEQGGDNTATDGDLDIAYALLLADKAWGSAGEIDYRASALDMIAAILKHEVSALGNLPDAWATGSRPATRSLPRGNAQSDFMLSHLEGIRRCHRAKSDGWCETAATSLIDTMTGK